MDLFLILLLVLCVVGVLFRWQLLRRNGTAYQTEPIELVLESEAIDPLASGCVSVGDWLYHASGEPLGRVMAVSYHEVEAEVLANGAYYVGAWDRDRLCAIRLTLHCTGRRASGGAVRVEGAVLSVGESVPLYSSRSALRYRVRSMTPKTA